MCLGSSTFLSMNCIDLHFGIGSAEQVDRIEVQWPSGVEQVVEDIEPNQTLELVEPEG